MYNACHTSMLTQVWISRTHVKNLGRATVCNTSARENGDRRIPESLTTYSSQLVSSEFIETLSQKIKAESD